MVWVTEPLEEPARCLSWRVLPLLALDGALLLVILWRIVHQVYWKSHPRRVFFHVVLLVSCAMRWLFWFSLCRARLFEVGLAMLWWSNSLLLLCTASIIVQWWCAVSAGRVAVRELRRVKRFSLQHPLVVLHGFHLLGSIACGIYVIKFGLDSASDMERYMQQSHVFLVVGRCVNVATVGVDALVALFVARRLRKRLLAAAMSDDMKKKSVVQMTLLIVGITSALVMQMIMDVPVLATNMFVAFGDLRYSYYCTAKFFVPGVLLSLSFLYIMRRIEGREPVRLVVMPTASSLVEYEECASPCMWCEHHRRYNVGQNKWDVNMMTSFSPRTVESSFRSGASASVNKGGGGMPGSAGGMAGGTFPADLETPLAWSTSLEDCQAHYLPTPPLPRTAHAVRSYSGRRIDAGVPMPISHHHPHHHHHHHHHYHLHHHHHDHQPSP